MNKAEIAKYLKSYDRRSVTDFILEYHPEEATRISAQAEDLMENRFTFQDTWDMEPCSVPYTLEPMRWDQSPNKDPEWIFMLNRHGYLHKLLLTYWFSGKEDFIDKLKYFLFHWIDNNPVTWEGGVTTRTIDTGIRCMSWIPLLIHLYGEELLAEEECDRILASIRSQFDYLYQSHVGKYSLSNWGVLQTTAICTARLWFGEDVGTKDLENWAWRELKNQMELQVSEDGSHWEQSVMYHIEVLNACTKLWNTLCWFHKEESHLWLSDILKKMNSYVLHAAAPNHKQIAQGDSDATDVRDVLTKAASLFLNAGYRFGGFSHMDTDSSWFLGKEGIQSYEAVIPVSPSTTGVYPDVGAVYLRSGWEETASFTCLFNGPLGSSHGHVDQTHISLYYQGKPFLTDSGRYTYVEEAPLRPWLKSAYSHNVCVIDHDPHGKPLRSWEYDSYGDCLKNYFREQKEMHYVEMAYMGNLKDESFYLISRKVVVIDQGIWLIIEDIRCDGCHRVEEYYHLDPEVTVQTQNGGSETVLALKHTGTKLSLNGTLEFRAEEGLLSDGYNEIKRHKVLTGCDEWKDRWISWTSLTAETIQVKPAEVFQYHNPKPVDFNTVTAVEFTISDELSYLVIVFHRETCRGGKGYICQNIPLYGKTVILKKQHENWERIRLRT